MADRLKERVALMFGAGCCAPGIGNGRATALAFAVAVFVFYDRHWLGLGLNVPQLDGSVRPMVGGLEAARLFLLWCGYHPAGETPEAAQTFAVRLDSLSRDRELAVAAAEHLHRMEVQRRLRERRAQEAAARYTHE